MNFKLLILIYLIQFKLNRFLFKNQLAERRNRLFRNLLKHLRRAPYYQGYLKKDTDILDFPVINKKEFMANFDRINTRGITLEDAYATALEAEISRDFSPMIKGITVGLSSGTSGSRGIFLTSENERARWVACILDRVIGFSFKKRRVAFFLRANSNLYESVKSSLIEFQFFDLLTSLPVNLSRLREHQPDILIAQPSMLMEIARAMEAGDLHISPSQVISVAEVLTPEDKDYLVGIFVQTIHQVYQCTEGFLAFSCRNGTLHFNEDFLVIEKKYIDQNQERFHPVITDLLRTVQPVIRYELNDIIIEKKNCACGSHMMAIERIEGRSDDILIFEAADKTEVKIFPDFFRRAIILPNNKIEDYTLTQTAKNQLDLYIFPHEPLLFDSAASSIISLLDLYNVCNVLVSYKKDKDHVQGTKLRRIKNDM